MNETKEKIIEVSLEFFAQKGYTTVSIRDICKNNISFHIFHPSLTRTKSVKPLPVPEEFMALPEKVGQGLAKNINSKHYIICHSWTQRVQTFACYLFPLKMGKLMSKMTDNYK